MAGEKATALAAFCAGRGQAMLRFGYSGRGQAAVSRGWSAISRWTADAVTMIDRQTDGPLVLVGSSMGGWIALLAALARPDRIAALIGIASAPDFAQALMWPAMTTEQRATLERDGVVHRPSRARWSPPRSPGR